MTPEAQVWWLRPVISAAREGEHSAVVWNMLYRRPAFASLSYVGVGIGPPKVLDAPKPTSSVRMSRTFGAPFGASMPLGKSGVDSLAVRPILPWKGGCGRGRTSCAPSGSAMAVPNAMRNTASVFVVFIVRSRFVVLRYLLFSISPGFQVLLMGGSVAEFSSLLAQGRRSNCKVLISYNDSSRQPRII